MLVNVTGPETLFRPGSPLYDQITFAATRGITVTAPTPGGVARLDRLNADYITPEMADSIVALGGDVENYERFIVVPVANLGDDVPGFLPNSTTVDEEETETPRTWAEYHGPNHSIETIGDNAYVSAGSFGSILPWSIQKQLADAGFAFVTGPELVAIRPTPEEE